MERIETLQALHRAKTYKQLSDLTHYAEKRRNYKILLKEKRADYLEKEAKKLAEEAKADPYLVLKKRTPLTTGEITTETWENHFTKILNQ
jgi:dihydroneopterin aldolase